MGGTGNSLQRQPGVNTKQGEGKDFIILPSLEETFFVGDQKGGGQPSPSPGEKLHESNPFLSPLHQKSVSMPTTSEEKKKRALVSLSFRGKEEMRPD